IRCDCSENAPCDEFVFDSSTVLSVVDPNVVHVFDRTSVHRITAASNDIENRCSTERTNPSPWRQS
ncbi:MAG TPA: hypothetical protein VK948_00195, partial [Aeromicrobium sp.]|nr:hypothetical protein [Aeromicrobium sp.]